MAPERFGAPSGLNAVLYFLHSILDVDDSSVYEKLYTHLVKTYSVSDLARFQDAVEWALENRDYEFENKLPGLRKSHDEVLRYIQQLKEVLASIKQLESR